MAVAEDIDAALVVRIAMLTRMRKRSSWKWGSIVVPAEPTGVLRCEDNKRVRGGHTSCRRP